MDGSGSHRHFRNVFSGRLKELLPPLFLSLLLPPLFMPMDLLVKLFDRGIWHYNIARKKRQREQRPYFCRQLAKKQKNDLRTTWELKSFRVYTGIFFGDFVLPPMTSLSQHEYTEHGGFGMLDKSAHGQVDTLVIWKKT